MLQKCALNPQVTAVRYDGADWPATISIGPGYYGLRIDTDHGTAVEYVDARTINETRHSASQAPGALPASAMTRMPGAAAGCHSVRAHAGARCEEAA